MPMSESAGTQLALLEERLQAAEARAQKAAADVAARDDLIATMSHELNNALAPVMLSVERLRLVVGKGDADRTESAIALVERAADNFGRRSHSVLEFARISGTSAPLRRDRVDMSALMIGVMDRHRALAQRAGCELRASVAPSVIVRADRAALDEVMDRLMANALRFGAGRPLTIGLSVRAGGTAFATLQDGGPGVPAEKRAQLFDPHGRTRSPGSPGLGIGLRIAASLVKAMSGEIGVDGAANGGARFHVSLPVL